MYGRLLPCDGVYCDAIATRRASETAMATRDDEKREREAKAMRCDSMRGGWETMRLSRKCPAETWWCVMGVGTNREERTDPTGEGAKGTLNATGERERGGKTSRELAGNPRSFKLVNAPCYVLSCYWGYQFSLRGNRVASPQLGKPRRARWWLHPA